MSLRFLAPWLALSALACGPRSGYWLTATPHAPGSLDRQILRLAFEDLSRQMPAPAPFCVELEGRGKLPPPDSTDLATLTTRREILPARSCLAAGVEGAKEASRDQPVAPQRPQSASDPYLLVISPPEWLLIPERAAVRIRATQRGQASVYYCDVWLRPSEIAACMAAPQALAR